MDTYPLTFSLVGHELWHMIKENSLFIDVQKRFRIQLSLNTTSGGEISPNIDTHRRSRINAVSIPSTLMSQERVSIWRGTAMYFCCSMTWMIFLLMTLSSINNWSVEMRSTKAELLHWNFWQYEKLLCSSRNLVITTLRFHTAYCHTYIIEVNHITRRPFSWKNVFLHLTQNNLVTDQCIF